MLSKKKLLLRTYLNVTFLSLNSQLEDVMKTRGEGTGLPQFGLDSSLEPQSEGS